jgi:hypothetical protein
VEIAMPSLVNKSTLQEINAEVEKIFDQMDWRLAFKIQPSSQVTTAPRQAKSAPSAGAAGVQLAKPKRT